MKSQKGIALIETLLIILILVIIGFGGYYVYHSQKQTNNTLNSAKEVSSNTSTEVKQNDPYLGWKTYTDASKKWSVRYPSDWILTPPNGATRPDYIDGVAIGPAGNELLVNFATFRSSLSAKDLLNFDNQQTVTNGQSLTINGKSAFYQEESDGTTDSDDAYGIVGNGIGISIIMTKKSQIPTLPPVDNSQYIGQFNLIAKSVRIL